MKSETSYTPALEEGHIENRCKGVHGFEKERLEDQPLFKLFLCLRELCWKGSQNNYKKHHKHNRRTSSWCCVSLTMSDFNPNFLNQLCCLWCWNDVRSAVIKFISCISRLENVTALYPALLWIRRLQINAAGRFFFGDSTIAVSRRIILKIQSLGLSW